MVNTLPSTPESTPCPIAEALIPPSCLNTIYGLSRSLLLSVSASRIKVASPEVPDEICTVPCGLLVPKPNLPSEVIRNFSASVPLEAVLKTIPTLSLPEDPPVMIALPSLTPIAAYSEVASAPLTMTMILSSDPLSISSLELGILLIPIRPEESIRSLSILLEPVRKTKLPVEVALTIWKLSALPCPAP